MPDTYTDHDTYALPAHTPRVAYDAYLAALSAQDVALDALDVALDAYTAARDAGDNNARRNAALAALDRARAEVEARDVATQEALAAYDLEATRLP